jgi:general secretion pathway protein D
MITQKKLLCLSLFFAALFIFLQNAHAESAQALDRKGQTAEAKKDYDAAYEAYKQAHEKKPKDIRYETHLQNMRFMAATQHIDRGRVLRQNGDYTGAILNFMRAAEVDPSNETALQEIRIAQHEQAALTPTSDPAHIDQKSEEDEFLHEYASLAAPVSLKHLSDSMVTYHATEDVKSIYTSLGKLAGLNIAFDPEYQSKRISVDLQDVNVEEALRVVETLSGTFYKPLTPNTILVAQNSRTKRTDLDQLACQIFYLTAPDQQNDANEILIALRNMLDPAIKIYLVSTQDAIVLRGTPDELMLAGKLIHDLDREKAEVVIDVAVMEVDRDKTRTLGITLPQSFSLTPQASSSNNNAANNNSNSGTQNPSSFTLNTLANTNATNFAVTVTGGTVNALLQDTNTRILQNPRLRATDGQKATLKIGQRVPVATGSLSSPVGGVSSLGVQTQFAYNDVGVNMEITPVVHSDGGVSLKMKVEVSQIDTYDTISNVQEPVIGQKVLEQTIKLRDGEPSILAGLVTKQDSVSGSGTPGLGELPILKYLFGTQTKTLQNDEIVFLLVPHIIRETLLQKLNLRPIDTGTANVVELRHLSAGDDSSAFAPAVRKSEDRDVGSKTTAATAAAAMIKDLADETLPGKGSSKLLADDGQMLSNTRRPDSGKLDSTAFSFASNEHHRVVGETFKVSIDFHGAVESQLLPMLLQFDPHDLSLSNVDADQATASDGTPLTFTRSALAPGLVGIHVSASSSVKTPNPDGARLTLEFTALAPGKTDVALVNATALANLNGKQEAPPVHTTIEIDQAKK